MMEPYYADDQVTLYLGDMREILPALDLKADLVLADPPYAETSLAWDRWPDGWPALAATVASSMWCFGSMRMFLDRRNEFDGWKLSQDVVWEKPQGTSFTADRFRRVHEHVTHWYVGSWRTVHHEPPREAYHGAPVHHGHHGAARSKHMGEIANASWVDDGTRLLKSVIRCASPRGRAIHPTEKPIGVLDLLIKYACPEGGLVVDPFAGSGSTLDAARQAGRRAVGIEAHEPYAEAAALRLSALVIC